MIPPAAVRGQVYFRPDLREGVLLTPRTKRDIERILPFGFIWLFLGVVSLVSDHATVAEVGATPDSAIRLTPAVTFFALTTVTLIGMGVGALEVLILRDRFASYTLAGKLIRKTALYVVLMSLFVLFGYVTAASIELGTHPFDVRVREKLWLFLPSLTLVATAVQLLLSLLASFLWAEVSELIGHGVLVGVLTGRYHKPREEVRIFLFSDMKSSTQIAEDLGHLRYFELLRAYYRDLASAIIRHEGEVYQYIGDEIVVSWRLEKGILRLNCLRCFFAMKAGLAARASWYQSTFGQVPDFKAGLHVGPVTAGEIGALKKEIVFTGDVLNATARIQGLCGEYARDLLVSGQLVEYLGRQSGFKSEHVASTRLRGREEPMSLFGVAELGPTPVSSARPES